MRESVRYHADMSIEKQISPLKIKKNNSKQKGAKMSSKNKIDYAKKEVFIGIDVHKRTYSLAAVCEGALVKKGFTLHLL